MMGTLFLLPKDWRTNHEVFLVCLDAWWWAGWCKYLFAGVERCHDWCQQQTPSYLVRRHDTSNRDWGNCYFTTHTWQESLIQTVCSHQWSYLGCQNTDSASSSKFHHLAFLALLVALVSHSSNFHHLALLVALVLRSDSSDLNFAILYMIIGSHSSCNSTLNAWLSLSQTKLYNRTNTISSRIL